MFFISLLPWSGTRFVWRRVTQLSRSSAVMFLWLWVLVPLVLFSLVSGKQIFYLLPEFIPVLILFAAALKPHKKGKKDGLLAFIWATTAAAIALLPAYQELPSWLADVRFDLAALFALLSIIFLLPYRQQSTQIKTYVLASLLLIGGIHFILSDFANSHYQVKPMADLIASKQQQGFKVAHLAKYHGQYHFVGRLEQPLVVITGWGDKLKQWLLENPNDYVVFYQKTKRALRSYQSSAHFPYAGEQVLMLQSKDLLSQMNAHP